MDNLKTPNIIPRYYGIVLDNPGVNLFFSPMHFVKGAAIYKTRSELEKMLDDYHEGIPEYLKNQVVTFEEFREAVKQEEGTYNLCDLGKDDFVSYGFFGDVLEAKVKSSTDGRAKGKARSITIRFQGDHVWQNIVSVTSPSEDSHWAKTKRGKTRQGKNPDFSVVDAYNAAALYAYATEEDRPEILPFDFPDNVIMDILLARYVFGQSYFDIGKRVLQEYVPEGDFTFQVVQEKKKKSKINEADEARYRLNWAVEQDLEEQGFVSLGKGLVFQGTALETAAEIFGRNKVYCAVINNELFPPLAISYRLRECEPDGFGKLPIRELETNKCWIFDFLRVPALTRLTVPVQARQFPALKTPYRDFLRIYKPEKAELIKKKIGL